MLRHILEDAERAGERTVLAECDRVLNLSDDPARRDLRYTRVLVAYKLVRDRETPDWTQIIETLALAI